MESLTNDLVALNNRLVFLEKSLKGIQNSQPPKVYISKQPLQDSAIQDKLSRQDFPLRVSIDGFNSVEMLQQAIGKPIKVLSKDETDTEIMGIAMGSQRIGVLIDELHSIYPTTKYLFLLFLYSRPVDSEAEKIAYAKQQNIELFFLNTDRDKKEILDTPQNKETLKRLNETVKQLYN